MEHVTSFWPLQMGGRTIYVRFDEGLPSGAAGDMGGPAKRLADDNRAGMAPGYGGFQQGNGAGYAAAPGGAYGELSCMPSHQVPMVSCLVQNTVWPCRCLWGLAEKLFSRPALTQQACCSYKPFEANWHPLQGWAVEVWVVVWAACSQVLAAVVWVAVWAVA